MVPLVGRTACGYNQDIMTEPAGKSSIWDYLYLFIVGGIVLCVDLTSKILVRSLLQAGQSWVPFLGVEPYARVVNTWNTGMAFGILGGTNGLMIALNEIIIVGIVFLYPLLYRGRNVFVIGFGLGLILGGALGNLLDRVTQGYVTDLIYINYLPVFNMADLGIVTGSLILALGLLMEQRIR